MTPTKWERVKELFDEALKFSGSGRTAVLERADLQGTEVRGALEKLLDDHDRLIRESGPFVLDDVQVPSIYSLSRRFAVDELVADRYRIVRFIAQGGMGEVYEAQDLELERRVALKVLRDELNLDPDSIDRFKDEITLAQRVTHPNVCRIFDLGRHDIGESEEDEPEEVVFLTMELLAGETLADHLEQNGRMTCSEALPLVQQMADALSALHEARVVHRDFKPGNVMLIPQQDGESRVVVTDLGLARSTPLAGEEDQPSTKTLLICTPEYVAPEQLTGAPANPSTDVYAFGLVLYEMVTGERPFSAPTPLGSIVKRLTTPPKRPSQIVPGLNKHWEATILHCLEREPEKRFTSVSDVVLGLQGKLDWGIKRWARIAASAALAAVLIALLWSVPQVRRPVLAQACQWFPGSPLACVLPEDKDLAVLPFENLSSDPESQAFADGLTAHLSGGLYRLAPDKESMCVHLRDDRNAFGVNLVLTGEVERRGDVVRLHATVRDAETEHLLREWEREVPVTEAAALHGGLLRDVAEQLELEIPEARWEVWEAEGSGNPAALGAYFQGLGHIEREEYEAAARAFDQATESDFSFALAHVGLGDAFRLLHAKNGESAWATRARNAYQVAEGLSDQQPKTFFGLGELEISLNNYEAAVDRFRQVLEIEPYDFDAQRRLAMAYQAMNQLDEAERLNLQISELRPECWAVYNHLGIFYLYSGRYADAQEQFLRVVQLAPDNGTAFNNLAFLYNKLGRFPDAVRRAKEAIELGYRALGHLNLGRAYFFQRCYGEAIEELTQARQLAESDPRVYSYLGEAYQMSPEMASSAFEMFRRAVEHTEAHLLKNQFDVGDLPYLALNLARTGETDRAVEEIERALALAPNNTELKFYEAVVMELAGDRDRALAAIERALSAGYSVFYVRGWRELRALRQDPKYQRLLNKLDLDEEIDPGSTSDPYQGSPCRPEPTTQTARSWFRPGCLPSEKRIPL